MRVKPSVSIEIVCNLAIIHVPMVSFRQLESIEFDFAKLVLGRNFFAKSERSVGSLEFGRYPPWCQSGVNRAEVGAGRPATRKSVAARPGVNRASVRR